MSSTASNGGPVDTTTATVAVVVTLGKILNPSLLFVSFPALFSHYFLFIIITNN